MNGRIHAKGSMQDFDGVVMSLVVGGEVVDIVLGRYHFNGEDCYGDSLKQAASTIDVLTWLEKCQRGYALVRCLLRATGAL